MKRKEKIEGLLKSEIADILHSEISDPRIGFVTISRVTVSDDFRNARVYFSVMGNAEERKRTETGLQSARTYIQNLVGSRIRIRFVPLLDFYVDDSLSYSAHIDSILHDLQADTREQETND
ncbi:30S ribosome-binding factor RbfA [bacterium]|nr:30S ribosome-binding factor RbfA [bacterium]